eukprot:TRINITY_DN12777_c1_g1_i1.p1 TRINITY_DN12777_c1_g1~~TRINITY_DN12777_c1_g1_i1.p1  ORF type:complete len:469 (+),score=72.13 TRINITY_DN12777_c1_g1_i1:84-1409(+)
MRLSKAHVVMLMLTFGVLWMLWGVTSPSHSSGLNLSAEEQILMLKAQEEEIQLEQSERTKALELRADSLSKELITEDKATDIVTKPRATEPESVEVVERIPDEIHEDPFSGFKQSPVSPPLHSLPRPLRLDSAKAEAIITQQEAAQVEKILASQPQKEFKPLGTIGLVLNAFGDQKYVEQALQVVANVKSAMPSVTGFTIWAHKKNKGFLSKQKGITGMYYDDIEIPKVVKECPNFQAPPLMFMSKITALTHSPYDTTIVMDNDIHVCNSFDHLLPSPERNFDMASAVAPFARWGGSKNDPFLNLTLPNDPEERRKFSLIQERNVGIMILRTSEQPVKQLLQLWNTLYAGYVNNTKMCVKCFHEQPAMREALFLMKGKIHERLLPLDKVCRQGNAIRGCVLKKGCVTDGCDIVHCNVKPSNAHLTRDELRSGKRQPVSKQG